MNALWAAPLPSPAPPPTGTSGAIDAGLATIQAAWINAGSVILGAVFAAVIAAWFAVRAYRRQKSDERAERLATLFADAIGAVIDYREAAYRIRRRDGSAHTRFALTSYVSDVQSRLSRFEVLIPLNSNPVIAALYAELVRETRREAGSAMTKAWHGRRTRHDRDVPIRHRIDMPRSEELLQRTLLAMTDHAGVAPVG